MRTIPLPVGTGDASQVTLLAVDTKIDTLLTNVNKKVTGRIQIFEKAITEAADAGDVVVATVTTQGCFLKRIVIRSNGATTADLTHITLKGGAGKVITFIDSTTGAQANIDAEDKQVWWEGAASLDATKTIVMTLTGTGATPVDLTVIFEYEAQVDGGYLA
jgi:hypothetical protein